MKKTDFKKIIIRFINHLMENNDSKRLIIIGSVFLACFLISFLLFAAYNDNKVRRVLFFPDFKTGKLVPEVRNIKTQKDRVHDITSFVEELINGSALPERSRLFPLNTKIITIYQNGATLTLNFSNHILLQDNKLNNEFQEIFQSIINNVLFNFKGINEIIFYIENELLPPQITLSTGAVKEIYVQKFDKNLLK